jgi:hypothetical protein
MVSTTQVAVMKLPLTVNHAKGWELVTATVEETPPPRQRLNGKYLKKAMNRRNTAERTWESAVEGGGIG